MSIHARTSRFAAGRAWLTHLLRLIPAEDRKVLLSPPRLVARFARFALHQAAGRAGQSAADDIAARDPELVGALLGGLRLAARYYFRLRVEGVEHVPARGPVLLVGNHSGGIVPTDGFLTALAIHDHHGPERALYALTHDFMFEDPLLRRFAGRLGLLRAGHESARHAFAAGAAVLVYPGSDLDTYRDFRHRDRVVLGGRKGFLRLALRERVPIVPVVDCGTQEQFVVLSRGDRLARRLHAHRWLRAEVIPLIAALPWGLTSGFLPYLPLPSQTTIAFLPPMSWPDLGPEAADDPEILDRCYREVEQAMQATMDRLSRERRFLLGQRRPRPPRPPDVSVRTEVAAPAAEVWRVLTDLPRYRDWNPFIHHARGDLAPGGDVHVRVHTPMGLPFRFRARVTARDDGRELRWRGHVLAPWLAAGDHTFTVEPIDAQRSRIIQEETFSGLLPRLARGLLLAETAESFARMNRALAATAEHASTWMLSSPPVRGVAPRFATRLEAVGAHLPERRLTTPELMASTRHHPDIDLERLTGIRERRVCGPGEDSLTLAVAAARDCLARSRHRAGDLDLVISTSISRHAGDAQHRIEPPLSHAIAHAIGATRAQCLDLSNACAGMLTGVFLLHQMIGSGAIRRGLVVSGEHISGLGQNAAREVRTILSPELASLTLGDAGAAVLVDRAPADHPGIELMGFTTLAEHSRLCVGLPSWSSPGARMFTRARTIHKVAMSDGPPIIEEVLADHARSLGDFEWMIPHQTSVRAIAAGERALAERTGTTPHHTVVTVDDLGNTASTTLFLALHRMLSQRSFAAGDRILLLSAASGLELGLAALVMDELRETHGHLH